MCFSIGYNASYMNMEIFEQMRADQLRSYLAFFMRHYRQLGAFWFIYLTEKYDQCGE
jgi:hypothetical protein